MALQPNPSKSPGRGGRARGSRGVLMRLNAWLAAAVLLCTVGSVRAESTYRQGSGSATARVNFAITFGHRLFLGIGTGATTNPLASNGTLDTVTFNYSGNPQAVGTGAAASSVTGAAVNVRVYGNNGQITLSVSNPPNLVSGTQTIPFSQITVTSSTATLPAPAMGGAPVYPLRDFFGLLRTTNRSAVWTFRYANTVAAAPGVYTGQVTYTAAML